MLSIHLESGQSQNFEIDEYSNVAIDHDQNFAAVIKDSKVIVYNYRSGQVIQKSEDLQGKVVSLSFLPKGNGLLISKEDGTLHNFSLESDEREVVKTTMDSPISHFMYNEDETYMVTWDIDSEQAMMWDLNLMTEIAYVPYFFGISPDYETIYGYEAFNLYGMNRKSLEGLFE